MQKVSKHLGKLREWLAALGPYLMLELVLPGGTVVAFLLFLHRRRQASLAAANPS